MWSHINTELQQGAAIPCTLTSAQWVHTTLSHYYFSVFALWKEEKKVHDNCRGCPASEVSRTCRHGHYLTLTFLTFPLAEIMILCPDAKWSFCITQMSKMD